jgi:hypothetical protein
MRATLTPAVFELTWPTNSSMSFGFVPAATTSVGFSIKVGMITLSLQSAACGRLC